MNEEVKLFRVTWHTAPSPAAPFYQGVLNVWAENEENAEAIARHQIHRREFPDFSNADHIVISDVKLH